jgi:hypothetical protein
MELSISTALRRRTRAGAAFVSASVGFDAGTGSDTSSGAIGPAAPLPSLPPDPELEGVSGPRESP